MPYLTLYRRLVYITLLISCIGCADTDPPELDGVNPFTQCVQVLGERCTDLEGNYCLFGFKWGEDPAFSPSGKDAIGPQKSGGVITYSFQEAISTVNTHLELDVPTQPFSSLMSCAKSRTRRALRDWAFFGDFEVEELSDDSDSDLKLYVADINTVGLGVPNIPISPCELISGHIILSPSYTDDCDVFYLYALHESGHALGLGHSGSGTVMGDDIRVSDFKGPQPGDIAGIRQIYGR